ncbi:major capsid and protease fusion protein [Arthrobacter phage Idaho]|uniref:Major capsid and protease fusion protein n=1 Tax=Arthrobacter phage Idaho TaxID=2565509 RepID=A0A4D6T823_9CAUD|nr:major capsid and protease fusion protein [Arthrobacter phage Idaho]QCG78270.1 major capsid and protease fusion protein [Arthrobacter phage Idaho]
MTTIQILGELATASAAESGPLRYRVVPFGETSAVMASGHQFAVDPGVLTLPADPTTAHVNEEHDRTRPVGWFAGLEETQDGIYGDVELADTVAGRDARVLAAKGLRRGISVEIENPVIRAGRLVSGVLAAAGLVVNPSFANAALASALPVAPDMGDLAEDLDKAAQAIKAAQDKLSAPKEPAADSAPDTATASTDKKDTNVTVTANAPSAAAAAAAIAGAASGTASTVVNAVAAQGGALRALGAAMAAYASPISNPTARAAAMDTVIQADVFDATSVPEYVGELWKGRRYAGRYLDLVSEVPMVSQSVIGWRWVAGKAPQVARWTPSTGATMNDIPTNEVQAESKTYKGFRIAGGHQVDRIHVDLPSGEWWQSYNEEAADDYARKLDAEVIAHVTDPANLTALVLPAGTSTQKRLLRGIGQAIEFADPDHILIGWDIFEEMADTKMLDQKAVSPERFAQSGGSFHISYLDIPVKVAPYSLTSVKTKIQIGSKNANKLHSLPGGPIRVDAEEIQKGTIQHGLFGYHILRPTDTRGSIDVQLAP